MIDDIRKAPLAAALRAVLEDVIAAADLVELCAFADGVQRATGLLDFDEQPALIYALRDAREHVADDKRNAGRIEEARKRRDGESDEEYRKRMTAFGLDDDDVVEKALGILGGIEGLPLEPGDEMPDDLVSVRAILRAWSARRMSGDEARKLMELDDEDDLYEIAHDNAVLPPDPFRRRDGEGPDDYARRMRRLVETVARIVRVETGTALDTTEPEFDIDFALANYVRSDWPDVLRLQTALKAKVSKMADIAELTHVLDFVTSRAKD